MIGSGGVNIAAAANIITTTYFLLSFKNVEFTTPILANKLNTTGNWKLNPNAKIKIKGVRPGEKIDEEMISVNDAPNTLENKKVVCSNNSIGVDLY